MSDAQINDTDGDAGDGDSAVMSELRAQLREAQKQLKSATERNSELEAQATQARVAEVRQYVDAAGFKGFDATVVLERVEGDVTAESVAAALASIGLQPNQASGDAGTEQTTKAPAEGASALGQRVADAAAGGSPTKSVEQRLAEATSGEEIAEIMADAGALTSYT